ncbi:MAG TPA: hypothetical protein PKW79_07985 [Rhabdochlamydiaceae bacterium]|nr:hypothetical protein [Rhabdochlamydiaceae bacterium]
MNLRKRIFIASLIALLLSEKASVFCSELTAQDLPKLSIEELVSELSDEDRKDLGFLFSHLIHENHFGYTLFGDKPVSIAGYFIREPTQHVLSSYIPSFSVDRLWKVWQKHASKFPLQDYLFLNELCSPKSDNLRIITIINKSAFLKIVEEHIDDFHKVLGREMTPLKLLEKLSLPEASLFEALHRNEVLYGILLGYGKHNAEFYDRRSLLMHNISSLNCYRPVVDSPYESFSLRYPRPSPCRSIEDEYREMDEKCEGFDLDFKLSPFFSPHFVAMKDTPETQSLKKKYREIHRMLVKKYAEGDFLTITLKQLTSDNS